MLKDLSRTQSVTNSWESACLRSLVPDVAVFLGVGDASAESLGNSACVLCKQEKPWLLIDCGHDSVNRFKQVFSNQLPSHVFITHLHYDHVGGLEQLFFKAALSGKHVRLYVPVLLVQQLCAMLRYTQLSEGKADVWSTFILHPVSESFWHQGVKLWVYPVRHHAPNSAYSLHLPGKVFYSGDTRPIPELLMHMATSGETIFHDCGVKGNPSHSGIDDLLSEYPAALLARLWAYHYHSEQDHIAFKHAGLKYVTPFSEIQLGQNESVYNT
ncbi:MBL fold metallo-hydrolase [Pseudoalteromonas sp. SMS1]|uniref:MBL fold metallo-hydrolase n=1 Tax=Pseudoalteromonas sp. SMS1 TaxID=2908894 RepID=UPI001F2332A3|nr:MBL fold metallo-hydrolase [Pseudoalteromonas sp. SMS1]MCF2857756.1 MBL fold metallo-hydrolase [Pseudoalteromonas sp. SMS1]